MVLYLPLVAAAIAYNHFAEPGISEDWRTILAWNGDGGWPPSDFGEHLTSTSAIAWFVVLITFFAALLAIQVGLFFFRAWARTGYLIFTVVFLLCVPFFGLAIYLPVEALFY